MSAYRPGGQVVRSAYTSLRGHHDHLAKANDKAERRAQLMANGQSKLVARLASTLGFGPGIDQHLIRPFQAMVGVVQVLYVAEQFGAVFAHLREGLSRAAACCCATRRGWFQSQSLAGGQGATAATVARGRMAASHPCQVSGNRMTNIANSPDTSRTVKITVPVRPSNAAQMGAIAINRISSRGLARQNGQGSGRHDHTQHKQAACPCQAVLAPR